MLNYMKIYLELLTDIDQFMFIERGIRCVVIQWSDRYGWTNNKYMDNNYEVDKESNYLIYFDINNLYGWAMQQYLPYDSFPWIDDVEWVTFNIPDDASDGYILQVVLEYPKNRDIPFFPELKKPTGFLQLFCSILSQFETSYRKWIQIRKIHRILKFSQRTLFKEYIDRNSRMRQAAKNDFEKNLYKLMDNADIKGWYGAEARSAQSEFHISTVIDESLAKWPNPTQIRWSELYCVSKNDQRIWCSLTQVTLNQIR